MSCMMLEIQQKIEYAIGSKFFLQIYYEKCLSLTRHYFISGFSLYICIDNLIAALIDRWLIVPFLSLVVHHIFVPNINFTFPYKTCSLYMTV